MYQVIFFIMKRQYKYYRKINEVGDINIPCKFSNNLYIGRSKRRQKLVRKLKSEFRTKTELKKKEEAERIIYNLKRSKRVNGNVISNQENYLFNILSISGVGQLIIYDFLNMNGAEIILGILNKRFYKMILWVIQDNYYSNNLDIDEYRYALNYFLSNKKLTKYAMKSLNLERDYIKRHKFGSILISKIFSLFNTNTISRKLFFHNRLFGNNKLNAEHSNEWKALVETLISRYQFDVLYNYIQMHSNYNFTNVQCKEFMFGNIVIYIFNFVIRNGYTKFFRTTFCNDLLNQALDSSYGSECIEEIARIFFDIKYFYPYIVILKYCRYLTWDKLSVIFFNSLLKYKSVISELKCSNTLSKD